MKSFSKLLGIFIFASLINSQSVNAINEYDELTIKELEGDIVNEDNYTRNESKITLKNFNIQQQEGLLQTSGVIIHGNQENNIIFEGTLYPVLNDSYFTNNLIIGDLTSNNNDFNILSFKIYNEPENNEPVLSIILENKYNGDWISFEETINEEIFKNFFSGAEQQVIDNNISNNDLKEQTTYLLNINNKADFGENLENEIEITTNIEMEFNIEENQLSQKSNINILSQPQSRTNFNRLEDLLSDVARLGRVNLKSYSNVPEEIFRGNGLISGEGSSNITGGVISNLFYSYRVNQIGTTLVQITTKTSETTLGSSSNPGTGGENTPITTSYTYNHGMILVYDHHTGDISTLYQNFGLVFADMEIAHGGLQGNGVFVSQILNGTNLSLSGSNVIQYFIALVPYASNISDIWGSLTAGATTNVNLGNTYVINGPNYNSQLQLYGNRVHRTVTGRLGNWKVDRMGANTNFRSIFNTTQNQNIRFASRASIGTHL